MCRLSTAKEIGLYITMTRYKIISNYCIYTYNPLRAVTNKMKRGREQLLVQMTPREHCYVARKKNIQHDYFS